MGNTYLVHHGVKGQKWGQRRFQNKDGSLTAEGRLHYGVDNPNNKVTSNVKETALRSAKRGSLIGAGVSTGIAGLGAAAILSSVAMPPAAAAGFALGMVGSSALKGGACSAAISAAWGAAAAHRQNKKIQQKVANGEKFVKDIPELTRVWVAW